MPTAIANPFPNFVGTQGLPLTAGEVFIGAAGLDPETSPIALFWNEALTQAAVQPVRTLNGHFLNGNVPGRLWTTTQPYSIRVRGPAGEQVLDAPSVTDLAGALASAAGFTLIKHKRGEAGTFARTAAQLDRIGGMGSSGEVSVHHWIDPDLDAAILNASSGWVALPYIQNALDYAPIGSRLMFAANAEYRLTTAAQGLIQTRHVDIIGGNSRVSGYYNGHNATDVWTIEIEEAANYSNDCRLMRMEGMYIHPAIGGRDGLRLIGRDGTNDGGPASPMPLLQMEIVRCRLGASDSGSGVALRVLGYVNQGHKIRNCTIENGIYLQCTDAVKIEHNWLIGNKVAVTSDLYGGVFRVGITDNVIVTKKGALLLLRGSQMDFMRNQIEQVGLNDSTYKASVVIYPNDYLCTSNNFIANNFGGGTNVETHFHLVGGSGGIRDTFIDDNVLSATSTSYGARLYAGADYTHFGAGNRLRGSRDGLTVNGLGVVTAGTNTIDPRPRIYEDAVGTSPIGTFGVWRDNSRFGITNGWTQGPGANAFGYIKEQTASGGAQLRFRGRLIAGTIASGTPIGVLPPGYRPEVDIAFYAINPDQNTQPTLLVLSVEGELRCQVAPTSGVQLHMNSVPSQPIQGHADYQPGP